jgi:putative transposase
MTTDLIRTYSYRIYPTAQQEATLRRFMAICCDTWNAALEQRVIWWNQHNLMLDSRSAWSPTDGNDRSLSQTKQLQVARRELDLKIPAQTHNYVLVRMDIAFKRLRTHRRNGGRGGFPKLRAPGRWRTLDFPSYGQSHKWLGGTGRYRKIWLRGVGDVLVRQHRALPDGHLGRVTVTERSSGRWMVGVQVRSLQGNPLPETGNTVGVIRGFDHLIGMSDGRLVEEVLLSSKVLEEVARSQAAISRTEPSSKHRAKAKRRLARAYERATADRDRQLGELARSLVESFDEIVLGRPGSPNIRANRRGIDPTLHQISGHGWHVLNRRLQDGCEMYGRILTLVDARDAHNFCPACDSNASNKQDGRFSCTKCGYQDVRDIAAAKVVLRRGRRRV